MFRIPFMRVGSLVRRTLVPSMPRLQRSLAVSSSLSDRTFTRGVATGSPKQEEIKQSHYDSLVERKLYLETPFKKAAGVKSSHVEVTDGGKIVEVRWDDGLTSRYHSLWLRHACHCPSCRISANQAKLTFTDIDLDTKVVSAEVEGGKVLQVKWNDGRDHTGLVPLPFLKYYDYSETARSSRKKQTKMVFLHENKVPQIEYNEILESDEGLYKWMDIITTYGVCHIKNASTDLKAVGKIMNRIDRPLHVLGYGDFYDAVIDDPDPETFAFAAERLPVHMDLQIQETPGGVQFLHCIRFDEGVTGGESVFVDMIHMAEMFRQEHPQEFKDLCRIPAHFSTIFYRGNHPKHIACQKPHIALDGDGEITSVKWHPPSTIPLQSSESDMEAYYRAYKLMESAIDNFPYQKVFKIEVGDMMTQNNRRWGHGRKQFDKSAGKRHIRGGYMDMDTFKSTCQILSNTVGDGKLVPRVGNNSWD